MRLPIDTTDFMFLVTRVRPVTDQNGEQRTTKQGLQRWTVEVAAVHTKGDGGEVLGIGMVGAEPKLSPGQTVGVRGLVANPWEFEGRHGISYSAEAIEPTNGKPGGPS